MTAGRALTAGSVLVSVLAGCSLAPHYERPSVPQPAAAYKEAGEWKVSSPADTGARGRWWTMFGDSDLDALPLGGRLLDTVERVAIKQTLAKAQGNKLRAARMLGIASSTLYKKMKKYGL